jgi:hypothetical protein
VLIRYAQYFPLFLYIVSSASSIQSRHIHALAQCCAPSFSSMSQVIIPLIELYHTSSLSRMLSFAMDYLSLCRNSVFYVRTLNCTDARTHTMVILITCVSSSWQFQSCKIDRQLHHLRWSERLVTVFIGRVSVPVCVNVPQPSAHALAKFPPPPQTRGDNRQVISILRVMYMPYAGFGSGDVGIRVRRVVFALCPPWCNEDMHRVGTDVNVENVLAIQRMPLREYGNDTVICPILLT